MRKFTSYRGQERTKNLEIYWQNQYFKGQLGWYKTEEFCSLYSQGKNKIFPVKIVK